MAYKLKNLRLPNNFLETEDKEPYFIFMDKDKNMHPNFEKPDSLSENAKARDIKQPEGEIGGSDKGEPTRFGDWSFNGRCSDF